MEMEIGPENNEKQNWGTGVKRKNERKGKVRSK